LLPYYTIMGALLSPTGDNFVQKTLGAELLAGATTVTLNNTTNIPNLPGAFIVDRIDTNDVETPNAREVITYTGVSGSTLTGLTRNADGSGSDQTHAINAIVEFGPDVMWAQSVYDAISATVAPSTGLLDTTKVADLNTAQTLSHKTLSAPNLVVGSDARGDMYFRGSGASLSRLALGAAGSVLVANATYPAWSQAGVQTPFINFATNATISFMDFSQGNKWFAQVTPNTAVSFRATNATLGYVGMLRIKYLSTASLAVNFMDAGATISWPANTAPTPTATIGQTDMFGFVCIETVPRFAGVTIAQNI
jgi:hypothetical protein